MDFDAVRDAVAGLPYMTPERARTVYDRLRETGARDALEIGTAHGVSTAYIAAAIAANGGGTVTTVDHQRATWDPPPEVVLERAGLRHLVEIVRVPHSSYVWWLREQLGSAQDGQGNVEPRYDFCYLDGGHNFTLDGLSALLVQRLLRPGAWLLMDDLGWTYAEHPDLVPAASTGVGFEMSPDELATPQLREVFDLLVRGNPAFDRFEVIDEHWGWARKGEGERQLKLSTTTPPSALAAAWIRHAMRKRSVGKALRRRSTS